MKVLPDRRPAHDVNFFGPMRDRDTEHHNENLPASYLLLLRQTIANIHYRKSGTAMTA